MGNNSYQNNINMFVSNMTDLLVFLKSINYERMPKNEVYDLCNIFEGQEIDIAKLNRARYYLKLIYDNNLSVYGKNLAFYIKHIDIPNAETLSKFYTFSKTLHSARFAKMSDDKIALLFDIINNDNLSEKEIKQLLWGAKQKGTIFGIAEPDLMQFIKKGCYERNKLEYEKLNNIFQVFKSNYKPFSNNNEELFNEIIIPCFDAIRKHNTTVDQELQEFAEGELDELAAFASIYTSVLLHTNNSHDKENVNLDLVKKLVVDTLAKRHSEKADSIINKETSYNLYNFLSSLKKNKNDEEIFNIQDIRNLLSQTTSLIWSVDNAKAQNIRNVLEYYLESVNKQIEESQSIDDFKPITSKEIILQVGTILNEAPISVYEAVQMLLGSTVGETYNNMLNNNELNITYNKNFSSKEEFMRLYNDLKITNMTPEKHYEILTKRPSLLCTLSLDSMQKATTSITDCIYQAFNPNRDKEISQIEKISELKNLGFVPNEFLDGDNISDIFQTRTLTRINSKDGDFRANLIKNISTLSTLTTTDSIQYAIKHNFNLLIANPIVFKQFITDIQTKSLSLDKFKENLNTFLESKVEIKDSKLDKNFDMNYIDFGYEAIQLYNYSQSQSQYTDTKSYQSAENTIARNLELLHNGEYQYPTPTIEKFKDKVDKFSSKAKKLLSSKNKNIADNTKATIEELNEHLKNKYSTLQESIIEQEQTTTDFYLNARERKEKKFRHPDIKKYYNISNKFEELIQLCKELKLPITQLVQSKANCNSVKASIISGDKKYHNFRNKAIKMDANTVDKKHEMDALYHLIETTSNLSDLDEDSLTQERMSTNMYYIKILESILLSHWHNFLVISKDLLKTESIEQIYIKRIQTNTKNEAYRLMMIMKAINAKIKSITNESPLERLITEYISEQCM